MKLRQIITSLVMMLTVSTVSVSAESFFPYPIVPDTISSLTGRCNFLANHFWDYCELSKAFSSKAKMAEEFKGYLEILQLADADTATVAIEKFTKRLDKQPKDLVFLADIAEGELYGDTAKVWIDGLYLPIAKAVVNNKRVDKASKARFRLHADILSNSMQGKKIADVPYTRPDGSRSSLHNDSAKVIVLYINDPDCSDCNLAKVRLDADINATELINSGFVKIVAISVTEPSDEWKNYAAGLPDKWSIGANPELDMTIDMRGGTPSFYVLDNNHRIRFKNLNIDQVLDIMRQLKKR